MKKINITLLILYCFLYATTPLLAQVQYGYVKTKGRLDKNGNKIAGTRLPDVIVKAKGLNTVITRNDGSFSLPIHSKEFYLQEVKKQGYVLIDPDALSVKYFYSTNPLVLSLETPAKQLEDEIAAQRKIRRTLEDQLKKKEEEIEELKAQHKLSEEEYLRAIQKIYEEQDRNAELVAEMARQYSRTDYDLIDSINTVISFLILNGDLTRADSLIRSKGDINSRKEKLLLLQEANLQNRKTLERNELLEKKEKEDLAQDCLNRYKINLMLHQNDSAAYYIDLRASLDSTNIGWQFDAAVFHEKHNNIQNAESYYRKALQLANNRRKEDSLYYDSYKAMILNNLAILNPDTNHIEDCEKMLIESLRIRQKLTFESANLQKQLIAQTLNNLGILYANTRRFSESEDVYGQALTIRRELANENPLLYNADLAITLTNLANLYLDYKITEKAEAAYTEALNAYQEILSNKPECEAGIAAIYNNLSILHYQDRSISECHVCFIKAASIYSRLAKDNPYKYIPLLENVLLNMRQFYNLTEEKGQLSRIDVYRVLAKDNPRIYEPKLAQYLNTLAAYYDNHRLQDKSESLYTESLALYRKLAETESEEYNPYIAIGLGNLSYHSILMKKYIEAEAYAREGLAMDSSKHFIYANLALSLFLQGKTEESKAYYSAYKEELGVTFLNDFNNLYEAGLISEEQAKEFEQIKQLISSKITEQ